MLWARCTVDVRWRSVILSTVFLAGCTEPSNFPSATWDRRGASSLGFGKSELDSFVDLVGGDGVVVRDGYIARSWGKPDRRRDWASAAKPVLSTLLFFALQEGKIKSLESHIVPWVRSRFPGRRLRYIHQDMTFSQLANMTSGYGFNDRPGTAWAYNDPAVKLLAELLIEVFDSSLEEALQERMAALQFEGGEIFGSRNGMGVVASPKDFARIGWFWLQQGRWQEQQLLPRQIFSRYRSSQVSDDLPRADGVIDDYLQVGTFGGGGNQDFLGQGRYGFFWWFNEPLSARADPPIAHLPPDAFFAQGHEGREVVLVLPGWNVVVAARGTWGGQKLDHARLLVASLRRGDAEADARER